MLENIVVRNTPGGTGGFDAGTLAEVLLFYGRARIVLDYGRLAGLARSIGSDGLLYLIEDPDVDFTYSRHRPVAVTTKKFPRTYHGLAGISLVNEADSWEQQIVTALRRALQDTEAADDIAKQIISKADLENDVAELAGAGKRFYNEVAAGLDSGQAATAAARAIIETRTSYVLPPDAKFLAHLEKDGLAVETNIDFGAVRTLLAKTGGDQTFGPAYVLSAILNSAVDVGIAAHYNTEFMASNESSRVARARLQSVTRDALKTMDGVSRFSELIFNDGKSIAEAINSGRSSFSDFLPILQEAKKFKAWLAGNAPDVGLVKSYFEEATKDTWIDRLPSRLVRFSVFTGLGIGAEMVAPTGWGIASSVTVGSVDSFLIDKMLHGWKPSHFVERELVPFVEPPTK